MIICILAPNDKVEVVRERAKQIPKFANHTALSVPVSATGDLPATHWFCTFSTDEELYAQIKALQEFSEVVEADPKAFLEGKKLKPIPLRKVIAAGKVQ
jgi:hypothetical protein